MKGTGSYSDVYRVRRLSDNKEYALKKVHIKPPLSQHVGKIKQVEWERKREFTKWSPNSCLNKVIFLNENMIGTKT